MSYLRHTFVARFMKKQSIIRIVMLAMAISVAVFVVAAASTIKPAADQNTEACTQDKQDCMEPMANSEYLLEALTRNLLGR